MCENKWIINKNVPCMITGSVKTKLTAVMQIIIVVTLQRIEDGRLWIRKDAGLFSEKLTEGGSKWQRDNVKTKTF